MNAAEGATTLFDKIWASHTIVQRSDGASLLFIDRHLIHEGSRVGFAT